MHPNVHRSTIYNSQDVETTEMSIDRGMDKEAVVYTHTEYYSAIRKNKAMWCTHTHTHRVLLSHKKE